MWTILFGKGATISLNHNTYEIPFSTMLNLVSGSSLQTSLAITSTLLVLGIPLIMLIYAGVKMLFRIRHNSRIMNISALGIWLVGIILGGITAVYILSNFKNSYSDTSEKEILMKKDQTLWLKAEESTTNVIWEDFLHID